MTNAEEQSESVVWIYVQGVALLVFGFLGISLLFAAWLTHLYVCLHQDRWGFLIAGALFFPLAIVHGIGIWFGIW